MSRRLYSVLVSLILAAQLWAWPSFTLPSHSTLPEFYMPARPIALLVIAMIVARLRLRLRIDSASMRDAAGAAVFLAAPGFALSFSHEVSPFVALAVVPFYATGMALMRAIHRRAFAAGGMPFGTLWTMIPLLGPFIALFVAGLSEELEEHTAADHAVRRLPFAIMAIGGTCALTATFNQYGWVLFVLLPIMIGAVSAYCVYDEDRDGGYVRGMGAAMVTLTWVNFLLAVLLLEGLVCLAMAAVIAYPLALLGSFFGTLAASVTRPDRRGRLRTIPLLFVLPLIAHVALPLPKPQEREVVTETEVDATPERVWAVMHNLEIGDETDDLLFRLGVAMPTATRTLAGGMGAARSCVLSTGEMREVITDWRPAKRLEFFVLDTPPCMKETGLHGEIETPHLTGKFRCLKGVFELTALPGDRTRIKGISLVRLDIHPTAYWGLWSDEIVHRVHRRVFAAISEKATEGGFPAAPRLTPRSSRSS